MRYSGFEFMFHVYCRVGGNVSEYGHGRGRAVAVLARWYMVHKLLDLQRYVCNVESVSSVQQISARWLAECGTTVNEIVRTVDMEMGHVEGIRIH